MIHCACSCDFQYEPVGTLLEARTGEFDCAIRPLPRRQPPCTQPELCNRDLIGQGLLLLFLLARIAIGPSQLHLRRQHFYPVTARVYDGVGDEHSLPTIDHCAESAKDRRGRFCPAAVVSLLVHPIHPPWTRKLLLFPQCHVDGLCLRGWIGGWGRISGERIG